MLISENPDDRVMVFIDLANVQRAVAPRVTTGLRLDYYRLVSELAGPLRLMGAYVFDSISTSDRSVNEPRRRLFDALRYAGFRVVVREVNDDFLKQGLTRVQGSLARAVEKGKLSAADRDAEDPGRASEALRFVRRVEHRLTDALQIAACLELR